MKTVEDLTRIVDRISYKDWGFSVVPEGDHAVLQLLWVEPDNDSTVIYTGNQRDNLISLSGRKWRLSLHMTESEVVLTALAAVKMAEEHELHERFLYEGKRIINPHVDVRDLLDLREDRRHSVEVEAQ